MRKFTNVFDASDWLIEADTGWEELIDVKETTEYEIWSIRLENQLTLQCADDHIVFDENMNEVFIRDLRIGSFVQTKYGISRVVEILNSTRKENMYDVGVNSENSRYYSNDILSHNTTTAVVILLHYALFNKHKMIALLSNKGESARDILYRIQNSYEALPRWLQQGVVEWNKGSVEFENGSRIVAGSTSSSSIRGRAVSFLYVDECCANVTQVTVRDSKTGKIEEITLEELYKNKNFSEILTENGFKPFQKVEKKGLKECKKIFFTDGSHLIASKNHAVLLNDGYSLVRELQIGDKTSTGKIVNEVIDFGMQETYDVVGVKDTWNYLSNGVTSHNCAFIENYEEFFSSVYPTISSGKESKLFLTSTPFGLNHFYETFTNAKKGINGYEWVEVKWNQVPGRDEKWKEETLKALDFDTQKFDAEFNVEFLGSAGNLLNKTALESITETIQRPIMKNKMGVRQYEKPKENHSYIIVCDVARGQGLDYSAFQVLDITDTPYRQVCTFHSNTIMPLDYAGVINTFGKLYNHALVLVETNDIGLQVSDSLHHDYEYDNLIYTQNKGVNGKVVTQGFGSSAQSERGIKTTRTVKNIGCSTLKILIEHGNLIIHDQNTVQEFYSFIQKGSSYEAEPGKHDDLVMALVLFAWLTSQKTFSEMADVNTSKALRDTKNQEMYEDVTPFGLFDNGLSDDDSGIIELDDF